MAAHSQAKPAPGHTAGDASSGTAFAPLSALRALLGDEPFEAACVAVLATLCEHARCVIGELWLYESDSLCCKAFWHHPSVECDDFERRARALRLSAGLGLAGQVLTSGRPSCFIRLRSSREFLRNAAAATAGLRGALGIPLRLRGSLLGAVLLFTTEEAPATACILDEMASVSEPLAGCLAQKRATESLRESELRHRSLFLDSPVSLWEQDFSKVRKQIDRLRRSGVTNLRAYYLSHPDELVQLAGMIRIVQVNRATLQLCEADSEEQVRRGLHQFFTRESYDVLREQIACLAEGKVEFQTEAVVQTVRGRRKHVALKVSVAPGCEQNWKNVFVSVVDMTERRHAEEALRESENRFRTIADQAPVMVWVAGPDGLCTFCNKVWLDYRGRSLSDELGDGWAEGVHPEDLDSCLAAYETAFRGRERFATEYRLKRADGEYGWVYDQRTPVLRPDGLLAGYIGSCVDITQRKLAESALCESEARFRSAFDAAAVGMALATPEGRYLEVNRAFCDLLGYSEAELSQLSYAEIAHPADVGEGLQTHRQLSGEGRRSRQFETRFLHKSGRTVRCRVTLSPVESPDGQLLNCVAHFENVTTQRELERQLVEAQKMEALGRLAGGIAHDFNNLLTVIRGYTELLRHEPPFGDGSVSPLSEIAQAADNATELVEQLLAFGRKQVLKPERISLNTVLEDARRMLRRVLGEHIQVATVPDPSLGLVKADPVQMQQVVLNLAINARDAMPQGGMLVMETANVTLDEDFARRHDGLHAGHYVLLTISDTGPGMDPETQARIFEPFFTLKGKNRGTGLGLASVYGIVKQSGGGIWVYSNLGWGTSFRIYLPRVQGESVPDARLQPDPPRQGSETVLLVEDDPAVRRLTRAFLEVLGYRVLDAGNVTEAVELSDGYRGTIHLLLTDVVMPDMPGRKLAEVLGRRRPAMKVLYVSGYTRESLASRDTIEPQAALLPKPYSLDEVAHAVRRVLDS